MAEETPIYRGSSSQVVNLPGYIIQGIIGGAILGIAFATGRAIVASCVAVPAITAAWVYINVKSRVYEITSERIRVSTGIAVRKTEELELYRVKDITMVEPLWLRLFKCGTIIVTTNDATTPTVQLVAVPDAATVREQLRKSVEACRDRKRVRISELE